MPRRNKTIKPGAKQRRFRQRMQTYRAARAGRVRRRIPRAAVPSFFTLMNLFCGFVAMTQAVEGRYEYAAWLIVLAGFFDLMDGTMARLMDGASLFGVELDSLSDVVSFGVAPAFLVYLLGLQGAGTVGVVIASLPAICGAVRLARFNVNFDGTKRDYFIGLPIPMQAVVIVALILNAEELQQMFGLTVADPSILVPVMVVLSGLMISNIHFDTVPRPSREWIRSHPTRSLLYGVAALVLIVLQARGLLIVLVVYLLHGMGRAVWNLIRGPMPEEPLTDV